MDKILVLYVKAYEQSDTLGGEYTSLFYLAGALKRVGYIPSVYHGTVQNIKERLEGWNFDAVGFSVDAENQHITQALIPLVRSDLSKKKGQPVPVVVGGPQAVALKEEFMKASGCDYILQGEGEETLPAIMDVFLKGKGKFADIPGLCWRDGEIIRDNPGFGLIEDLSTLPRPYYEAALNKRNYGQVVYASRGCPFSCTFCASNVAHKRTRLRKISDVLDEIRDNLAANPDMTNFVVQDDMFCTSPERIREFCAGLREIRKERDIAWFCEASVRTMKNQPELLKEMVDSGLIKMQIGLESGDPDTLKAYKKNVTVEEFIEFAKMAAECGLPSLAGNIIVGGPKEAPGRTEKFIRDLQFAAPGVFDILTSFLKAYPGTEISEDPDAFGLVILDPDDMTPGEDIPGVIPKDMTVDEVVELRQSINKALRASIAELIDSNLVPLDAIMRQFEAEFRYGLTSRWMGELKARDYVFEFYKTIYLGEGELYDPKKHTDPDIIYPQRSFEFYRYVRVIDGVVRFKRDVLTPLEYDILFYSSGKLTVTQIAKALWPKYKAGYPDDADYKDMLPIIFKIIEESVKKYRITLYLFQYE